MDDACLSPERIDEVAPGRPGWDHVESCARCWSLWRDHQAFLEADATGIPAADLAAADRLAPVPRTRARTAPRVRWLAAAAALVLTTSVGVWQLGRDPDPPTLRGDRLDEALDVGIRRSAGTITVEWTRTEGAEGYRVVFFDRALAEIHREETSRPPLPVAEEAIPTAAFVRVLALRAGDVVDQSALRALEERRATHARTRASPMAIHHRDPKPAARGVSGTVSSEAPIAVKAPQWNGSPDPSRRSRSWAVARAAATLPPSASAA